MKENEDREVERYELPCDLGVVYEGASGHVPVHPPDLSTRGMFINTSECFAVGSVLKVHFRLARCNFEVNVRAEVRHCLPGVGIGVEFLNLSPEAERAIEEETKLPL